ncbi:MAG: hypothetical protein IPL73_08525 [Candidatus Obscuribacter sp.]|nr:hypothetical protein [Candidatus Obscuribacter sp.]
MLTHSFERKDRQCNIYGHTMPTTGWTVGRLPHCGDCGAAISHPEDLRRAVPREY